jgi:hypothetical protein
MDLDQDPPEPVDSEPAAPLEGGDGGEASVEDNAPASEPSSARSGRDDAIASQARFYQEQAEQYRREVEQLRAAQRPDPREEQARIDAMDPEQRVLYFVEKGQRESQSQVAQIQAQTTAQIDQLKFDAQLNQTAQNLGWSNAQRARYAAEIEQMYNSLVQRNMTIPRGDLLRHKLGDELMTQGVKAVKSATSAGKANIAKQSARMTPASSNVTGKSSGMTKAQESMKRMVEAGVLEMN